jgi:hypothetical protein
MNFAFMKQRKNCSTGCRSSWRSTSKVGRILKDADESHAKSTSIERSPNPSSGGKSSIH